ncbi:hypothetical protein BDR06DRAFT_1025765 [Suillus hirtellus]|nr:hypothetical protein BDR06DRAFT_1025765 [Suillus hirtellus]
MQQLSPTSHTTISLFRDALALHPQHHPDRPFSLYILSRALNWRHSKKSNAADIREAAQLYHELLPLCPEGTYLRSIASGTGADYVIGDLVNVSFTLSDIFATSPHLHPYPHSLLHLRLELKNADYERLHRPNTIWYTALVDDLKLISIDAATGGEEQDAKLLADINNLITRAEDEREEIARRVTGGSFISSASEASEPELETVAEKTATASSDIEAPRFSATEPEVAPERKSDADSDSTIGASKDDGALSDQGATSTTQAEQSETHAGRVLLARYQEYLPPQGVEELARTALAPFPPMSESEQEYPAQPPVQRSIIRRHRELVHKPSLSDFESSYAVNVASGHLNRRSLGAQNSRIPGAVGSSIESSIASRRSSPDKRGSRPLYGDPTSSPPHTSKPLPAGGGRTLRRKPSTRAIQKDKAPSRPTSVVPNTKPQFRRTPQGGGSKVSNIARHSSA